jgi:hypothetical protein
MVQGKYLQVEQGKMVDQNQENSIFYKPLEPELYHTGLGACLVTFTGRENGKDSRTGKGHERSGAGMHTRCSHKKINGKSDQEGTYDQYELRNVKWQQQYKENIDIGIDVSG